MYMTDIKKIFYFIVTMPPQTRGQILLVNEASLENALSLLQNRMMALFPNQQYTAEYSGVEEVESFMTNLNLPRLIVTSPPAPTPIVFETPAQSEPRGPTNYEQLAMLLRDNGYEVTKKTI